VTLLPSNCSSWREYFASKRWFVRISESLRLADRNRTVIRPSSARQRFLGAQIYQALPTTGLAYFEARVFRHSRSDGGDYLAYTPRRNASHWVAVGVASSDWNCENCGWWGYSNGSGWYASGKVFHLSRLHTVRSEPIDHEDVVGVLIDRTHGLQYVTVGLFGCSGLMRSDRVLIVFCVVF